PRHGACCRRAWRAGSMVRHAPIHRRSGHSDIAICCGRNVRGSSPSTSVVPLSNQVTTLNHKRFKGFKMFSDGHLECDLLHIVLPQLGIFTKAKLRELFELRTTMVTYISELTA